MLGRMQHNHTAHIPALHHLDREVPVKIGDKVRRYQLYSLGWDTVDKHKDISYRSWVDDHWKNKQPPELAGQAPAALPAYLDAAIKRLTFALSENYRAEAQHYAQLYHLEWYRERPFDTVIREMCLRPAISAINCAFKLIADCIYDPITETWLREITFADGLKLDKAMIQSLMMYKFWCGSTGRGLVWDHAELGRLDDYARLQLDVNRKCRNPNPERVHHINRLLQVMREWESQQERFYSFYTVTATQPIEHEVMEGCDGGAGS